jgi:hypothetical protein
MSVPEPAPNQGLEPTAFSVRSSLAPASGSGSGPTFGEQPTRLRILRGESPLPSMARFGRLASPTWRKVTTSTVLGRKSHGCHTTVVVSVGATGVASKAGGLKRSD